MANVLSSDKLITFIACKIFNFGQKPIQSTTWPVKKRALRLNVYFLALDTDEGFESVVLQKSQ